MQSWADEYEAGRLNAIQAAFFEPRAAVELYDILEDPHGTVNLATQPEHVGKLRELSAALTGWQFAQRDAGLIPEAMLTELDRDGVINRKLEDDYVKSWDEFTFNTDVMKAMSIFKDRFEPIVVVTNQRGIGRGFMTAPDLNGIHEKMRGSSVPIFSDPAASGGYQPVHSRHR